VGEVTASVRLTLNAEDRAIVARSLRRLYEDPSTEREALRIGELLERIEP
jgi:hypothetical protein